MATAAEAAEARQGERIVTTAPGIDLHLRWVRPRGTPKGTVLLAHGVGEHAGRYGNLEAALTAGGWAFYAYDHRGHGRSTGRRVHVDAFDDYLDDLQKVYEEVRSLAGEGKVFVYGHSMGGLIVTSWAALRRPTVWGIVASAPAIRLAVKVPYAKILAARALSRVTPRLALANEVDPAALSRDPAVGRSYMMDPLVERKATVRWGAEFLDAVDRIQRRAHELETPCLLLHGEADVITASSGSADLHKLASSADKTLKLYPGFFHELHNEPEPDRKRVFGDVLAWLDARA